MQRRKVEVVSNHGIGGRCGENEKREAGKKVRRGVGREGEERERGRRRERGRVGERRERERGNNTEGWLFGGGRRLKKIAGVISK